MDLRKIKKLIELVEESGISELEVKSGDEAVRIARPTPFAAATVVPPVPVGTAGATTSKGVATADIEVRAPMAGTFYAAPQPDADAFVSVGQVVDAESIVCIIESMKMMNDIRLPSGGECVEILVANAEPVSAKQLLFRFRSSG